MESIVIKSIQNSTCNTVKFNIYKQTKTQCVTLGIIHQSIKYEDELYKKLITTFLDSNEYERTKINFST